MRFLPGFVCFGGSGAGMGSGGGDEVGDPTDLNTLDLPLSVGGRLIPERRHVATLGLRRGHGRLPRSPF